MRKEGRERWRKEGRDNRQKRRGRKREEKWNVAGFDSGNSGGKGNGRVTIAMLTMIGCGGDSGDRGRGSEDGTTVLARVKDGGG